MAIILFKCPYCGKKVETSEDNVGREGLCPGCQKIFEIPEPAKKDAPRAVRPSVGIGLGAADAPEYGDLAVLLGVGAVALGVAGVLAATFLPWLQAWTHAGDLMAAQKSLLIAGSGVCLAFLLVSALARKSLMAPALTGAAWGMFALVWAASIARAVGKAIPAGDHSPVALGVYVAIGAGAFAVVGAMFIYYQVRDSSVMEKFGLFLVVTQVVVLVGALALASHSLKPALASLAPKDAGAAQQPANPAPAPAARPRGQR